MKLQHIALQNYRRFTAFEIDLNPQLTVIAARNGQGKTTILEAIAAALGPFVGAFDYGKAEHIRRSDARYAVPDGGFENEQHFPVIIAATLAEPALQWQRSLQSAKGRTTTKDAAALADWGAELQQQLRHTAQVALPVLRYYSSKRLWVSHKNVSRKAILTESRTAGYEDCLSPLSSFVQLQEWMKKATQAVLQQREVPGYEKSNLAPRLKGIQQAVEIVMHEEGWSNFHYSYVFDELAMTHPDHGALPISMLSDGVRAMIALAADLALRCVRLNGYLGEKAPQQSSGIVLIDEVDLHLHPAWQQRVLPSLRQAFPLLQFIVSSHSPQVLTTVRREQIRIVRRNAQGQWLCEQPSRSPLAQESGDALAQVMDVSPKPPLEIVAQAHAYEQLVRSGKSSHAQAQSLKSALDAQGYEIPQAQAALWAFLAEQAGKAQA